MSSGSTEKDEILELIHLIENNKRHVFRGWDRYFADNAILQYMVPLFCLFIFMVLLIGANDYFSEISDMVTLLTLSIALFALNNAVIANVESTEKERLTNYRFNKMKKLVDADQRLLLKSLIKMKHQNKEINLEEAYKLNPDLFSVPKLIEFLYSK